MPGRVKPPLVSVVVSRDKPVAGLAIVTVAPGRAAFCGSATLPWSVEVPLCAAATVASITHIKALASHVTQCCRLIVCPPNTKRERPRPLLSTLRFEGTLASAGHRRGPRRDRSRDDASP